MNLKKIYIRMCAAATGLNLGIIVYAIAYNVWDLIPLGVLNMLLLLPAFFMKQDQEG